MRLIIYSLPIFIIAMIAFVDFLHYGYIAISCVSVVFFAIIHYISNVSNFKDVRFALFSIICCLAYDVVLSFPAGINAISFCFASLFYLKIRKIHDCNVKIRHYIMLGIIFFGTKTLAQYIITDRLNWQFLICQVTLFSICSTVCFYLIDKKIKSDDAIIRFN